MTWHWRLPIVVFCIGVATGVALAGQSCSRLSHGDFVLERQPAKNDTRACRPGPGASGSPRTVEQVVALVNSLPRPVSLACFLEALDRPLRMYASQSSASIQPSSGPENPRIFIFLQPLILTVTTDGPGAKRLEISSLKPGDNLSTKAELNFPVISELEPVTPYTNVYTNNGTSCRACHGLEVPDPAVTSAAAFISNALRPLPASEVDLNYLQQELLHCDPVAAPDRCLLLKILFGGVPNVRQDFPGGMITQ